MKEVEITEEHKSPFYYLEKLVLSSNFSFDIQRFPIEKFHILVDTEKDNTYLCKIYLDTDFGSITQGWILYDARCYKLYELSNDYLRKLTYDKNVEVNFLSSLSKEDVEVLPCPQYKLAEKPFNFKVWNTWYKKQEYDNLPKNSKDITRGYWRFSGYLIACVFTGVLIYFCYIQTSKVEVDRIVSKTEEYDKIYVKQTDLVNRIDSLYYYTTMFNTNLNDAHLLNSVSRHKQEI